MCGIFGVVAGSSSELNSKNFSSAVEDLLYLSESRGKEAAGVALMLDDELQVIKVPNSASTLIKSSDYKRLFDAKGPIFSKRGNGSADKPLIAIGHSRLVTNGSEIEHNNNQPVLKDGMVGIHNGIVVNDAELWEQNPEMERSLEVDTEVILGLIRKHLKTGLSLPTSVRKTFSSIYGAASIALLFEDLNYLLLATNNGSLYFCESPKKDTYLFSSDRCILQGLFKKQSVLKRTIPESAIQQVVPGKAVLLSLDNLSAEWFSLDESEDEPKLAGATVVKRKIVDVSSAASPNRTAVPAAPEVLEIPKRFTKHVEQCVDSISKLRRCTKCLLPETMPFIIFDSKGVCSYCHTYEPMKHQGRDALEDCISKFRSDSNKPDCVVAFSGGRDSSYGLHVIKNELKLNPIAYTYDWGMVTDLARRNISRMCGKLGVEHILVSADIRKKRANIRKNVTAWLSKPDLGLIPLFMAGDKQFFYYANKIKKDYGVKSIVFSENRLETTRFKTGFCGIPPVQVDEHTYSLPALNKLKLIWYYGSRYLTNPAYLNQSLYDTFLAYCSYYVIPHEFVWLFNFIEWKESQVEQTLFDEYDWETAPDTKSTWRIGDGTASFYNYIYYTVAGFTENDTFRSNQIREGHITREEGLEHIAQENLPRWETFRDYCQTIGIDHIDALDRINQIPKLFPFSPREI